jgi:hypothetical protein
MDEVLILPKSHEDVDTRTQAILTAKRHDDELLWQKIHKLAISGIAPLPLAGDPLIIWKLGSRYIGNSKLKVLRRKNPKEC